MQNCIASCYLDIDIAKQVANIRRCTGIEQRRTLALQEITQVQPISRWRCAIDVAEYTRIEILDRIDRRRSRRADVRQTPGKCIPVNRTAANRGIVTPKDVVPLAARQIVFAGTARQGVVAVAADQSVGSGSTYYV